MNRKKFCEEVANKTKRSPEEVEGMYLSIIDMMKERIRKDRKLTITGFGSFKLERMPARVGMNPREGSQIMIPERDVLKFKPSKIFLNECSNENDC